jgi:hypothetical protein
MPMMGFSDSIGLLQGNVMCFLLSHMRYSYPVREMGDKSDSSNYPHIRQSTDTEPVDILSQNNANILINGTFMAS